MNTAFIILKYSFFFLSMYCLYILGFLNVKGFALKVCTFTCST